jgi:hypothetical protein
LDNNVRKPRTSDDKDVAEQQGGVYTSSALRKILADKCKEEDEEMMGTA